MLARIAHSRRSICPALCKYTPVDAFSAMEESISTTEDRDEWRQYVHGVNNPRIEDG